MPDQVLLVDAGNTNIVFGVALDGQLRHNFRLTTRHARTADEYTALLLPLFAHAGLKPAATSGATISSVVPQLQSTLRTLCEGAFGCRPHFVGPGTRTGLSIRSENPTEVGTDRIVNAVAAKELYGAPVVVVDCGTATTFDVIDTAGDYLGGIIAPGLAVSADAMFAQAAKLYQVDVRPPAQLIGRSTVAAMQSGIFYGFIGLVDGILERLLGEIAGLQRVVATGGLATLIADGSRYLKTVDELLTLRGLLLIHERNRRSAKIPV